jgi:vacuolar protein sorting-associated protein 13A/C
LQIETEIPLQLGYYNIKNSHWEPLIEPWVFAFKVRNLGTRLLFSRQIYRTGPDRELNFAFTSERKLDLNVTHTLLETVSGISQRWQAQQQRLGTRVVNAPYIIRNETGHPIVIWSEDENTKLQEIPDGGKVSWRFEDWRTMREVFSAYLIFVPNRIIGHETQES